MKMVGKIVAGVRYLHISVMAEMNQLTFDENKLVTRALGSISRVIGNDILTDNTIIAIDQKRTRVSFTKCPDWNTSYEPSLGDCVTVDLSTGLVKRREASKTNPQIYHRRHLFVLPDYAGFNIQDDISRVKKWEALLPDKTRMGRRNWWDKFCEENNL